MRDIVYNSAHKEEDFKIMKKNKTPWDFLEEFRGKDFLGEWPTVIEMFLITAKRHPHNTCLTNFEGPDGSKNTLNYTQAKEKIEELGAWLVQNGVKKGDRIAVSGKNSPEWAVAFIASFFAGAIV